MRLYKYIAVAVAVIGLSMGAYSFYTAPTIKITFTVTQDGKNPSTLVTLKRPNGDFKDVQSYPDNNLQMVMYGIGGKGVFKVMQNKEDGNKLVMVSEKPATNIIFKEDKLRQMEGFAGEETIAGYRCIKIVRGSYTVWRAPDLNGAELKYSDGWIVREATKVELIYGKDGFGELPKYTIDRSKYDQLQKELPTK